MGKIITLLLLICVKYFQEINGDNYGLLYGRPAGTKDWPVEVCIIYNLDYYPLPTEKKLAIHGELKDFTPDFGCYSSDVYDKGQGQGKLAGVSGGNCTFVEKTDMAQTHGTRGLLIVSPKKFGNPRLNQTSDIGRFKIPTAVILATNFFKLQELGNKTELMMYAPDIHENFDPCLVIIFFLALLCVAVGAYWSGLTVVERQRKKEEKVQKKKVKKSSYTSSDKEESDDEKDEEHVDITIPSVLVFFVLVCGFLVLLYYFFDYLVFVIIALFCIAGSIGLYCCVLPLWNLIPLYHRIAKFPCCSSQPQIKNVMLYLVCATVAIVWAVERHESYAWVLQDILGVAFCINMLKTIQVPNLKICTILLTLLFLYDIFFVFITPYFTNNGESIMVKVATGGSGKSNEKLPMVFVVPRLFSPYRSCIDQPSMLGFGDVIVPGLLIGYNHGIDLKVNSRKVYYIATVIGYAVGMIITFVALEFMQTGQPALLYLVPCTLITTFVIGCIRGEVKLLWNGDKNMNKETDKNNSQPSSVNSTVPGTMSADHVSVDITSNASTIDSENKSLIRK